MTHSYTHSDCMAFSVKLFRVVGCWPDLRNSHRPRERLYLLYTATICSVLFVYTLILAFGIAVNYTTWSTLEEALEEIIVFATGIIVLLKVCLFLWKQNDLIKMIGYINNDLNRRWLSDEEDVSIINNCVRHERSLTKTYVATGYCITFLYTISSILKIVRQRLNGTTQQTLPLKYPFSPDRFPMYHLLYLHQMVVMVLNGHVGTLADTFFSCLAFYICGHFDILNRRIAKEGGIITRNFVCYHNEVFRLVGSLQSIFGSFLTFQLGSNSLLICLGVLQITQTSNIHLLHYIKCLIYVSIKVSQMFLYCWYGQEVAQKSSSIAHGAYCGVWHKTTHKTTITNLKMVLFRSQIPAKITAGGYYDISLPTLAKVINMAYSLFTMIKSTQRKE